ncbi:MAG: hypothetical protein IJ357_00730, partial [Oscillospiraceae bacterium]|nr:hypothetical protein [Oscillospiraceae bacterium]
LPEIQLPGPNVEAINAEILADYKAYYEIPEGEEQPAQNPLWKITYKWAVKGDILSVVILKGTHLDVMSIEEYGCNSASVYNISISKCRLVSNEEVYAAAGITDAQTRVLHAAASFAGEWYLSNPQPEVFLGGEDLAVMMFEQNISQENFDEAKPYFNEDGELCALAYVNTFIGAGRFVGDICVEDYYTDALWTAAEYYNYYAAKMG